MCFYPDFDWCAEVEERSGVCADSPARCYECRREIAAGEWRTVVSQQEHGACQICEDTWESDDYISGDADDYDSDEEHAAALAELATHTHDYGETFSCAICRECCLILEAIYDLEAKEGCPEYARQPAYGELSDEIHEDRERRYVRHAIELYPELAGHKLCE